MAEFHCVVINIMFLCFLLLACTILFILLKHSFYFFLTHTHTQIYCHLTPKHRHYILSLIVWIKKVEASLLYWKILQSMKQKREQVCPHFYTFFLTYLLFIYWLYAKKNNNTVMQWKNFNFFATSSSSFFCVKNFYLKNFFLFLFDLFLCLYWYIIYFWKNRKKLKTHDRDVCETSIQWFNLWSFLWTNDLCFMDF